MKHRGLLLIVAVGVLVCAPLAALAGGQRSVFVKGPQGGVVVVQPQVKFAPAFPKVVIATPSVFPKPVDPWKFWGVPHRSFVHKPFVHKPFVHGPFVGSAVIPFAIAAPSYYASAPAVTYAAPTVPAPSSSMPTLVEYENGFYELRGDGITVPYRWVWIPKVPPPPDPAPSVAPPAQAPSSPPARVAEEKPRKPSTVYRWTDDQGVTTYTDRLERVPERYRNQAKANPL